MSIELMTATWENKDFNPIEKYVMLALADSANHEGISSYSWHQRLSDKTGLTLLTVNDIIYGLMQKGYLSDVYENEDGNREYRITDRLRQ